MVLRDDWTGTVEKVNVELLTAPDRRRLLPGAHAAGVIHRG